MKKDYKSKAGSVLSDDTMGVIRGELKRTNDIMVDMKLEQVRATELEENYMSLRFLPVGSSAYHKSIKEISEEEKKDES